MADTSLSDPRAMVDTPSALTVDFAGKLAFVTGAGSGIGAATARLLGARGASVVLADIDLAAAEAVAGELRDAGSAARAIRIDVADAGSVQAAIESACASQGGLDLAVNAAGVTGALQPCADYELAEWMRIVGINLTGLFLCMRSELQQMQRRGGGAIVNISSIMGQLALPGTIAYAASKHGVEGATKAAALDYAHRGIRVNAVAPGYVDTPLIAGRKAATHDKILAMHPVGRIAAPSEIAELIVFLLSPRASFITGSIHHADGAYSTR